MAGFIVEWDDLSGGYFVSRPTTLQRENQWVGSDLILNRVSGCPAPIKLVTAAPAGLSTAVDFLLATQPIVATNGDLVWVERASAPSGTVTIYRLTTPFGSPAVQTLTFPGASTPQPNSRPVATNESGVHYVYIPTLSTYVARYNVTANTASSVTTPVALTSIVKWGDFMLGSDIAGTGKVYFSAPANFTSWVANDNFPVAQDGQAVTNLVPFPLELYIGKSTGWWVVQGIPGATATLRQIATTGGSIAVDTALGTPLGVMFLPTAGAVASAVQGINVRPLHFAGSSVAGPLQYLAPTGEVGVGGSDQLYVFHPMRYWSLFTKPSDVNANLLRPVDATIDDIAGPAPFGPVAAALYKVAGGTKIVGWPMWETVVDEAATGTVELREHRPKGAKSFTVKEILVEVLADRQATDRGVIGVDCAVRMAGRTDLPVELANVTSQTRTLSIHTDQLSTDRTALMYRFAPDDGGAGRAVTPIITLRGVALRRVVAVCEEAH